MNSVTPFAKKFEYKGIMVSIKRDDQTNKMLWNFDYTASVHFSGERLSIVDAEADAKARIDQLLAVRGKTNAGGS